MVDVTDFENACISGFVATEPKTCLGAIGEILESLRQSNLSELELNQQLGLLAFILGDVAKSADPSRRADIAAAFYGIAEVTTDPEQHRVIERSGSDVENGCEQFFTELRIGCEQAPVELVRPSSS